MQAYQRRADARRCRTTPRSARALAFALGEPSWAAFDERLAQQRADRRGGVRARRLGRDGRRRRATTTRSASAWAAGDVAAMLRRARALGRRRACRASCSRTCGTAGSINAWTKSAGSGSSAVMVRLDRRAGRASERSKSPASACCRSSRAVGRRSAYLALLNENPAALDAAAEARRRQLRGSRGRSPSNRCCSTSCSTRACSTCRRRARSSRRCSSALTQGVADRRRRSDARRDSRVPTHGDFPHRRRGSARARCRS